VLCRTQQSGADLYESNFTDLQTSGTYRVEVPGLGRSLPFEISYTVYYSVYQTVARLLYHKHSTRIEAQFALNVMESILSEYVLSRGKTPFDYKNIRGGWLDAGNYGLYMHDVLPTSGVQSAWLLTSAPYLMSSKTLLT
jgi:hypothetical protein